jgi:DNA-binding transcriptional ArsR family regulator
LIDKKKSLLFEKQAEIVKAVALPVRLAIIEYLKSGEKGVCDIAEHIGSERSNVSRHLSVMVNAGILDSRKEGVKLIYRLKCRGVLDFLGCVTQILRHQVEEDEKLLSAL